MAVGDEPDTEAASRTPVLESRVAPRREPAPPPHDEEVGTLDAPPPNAKTPPPPPPHDEEEGTLDAPPQGARPPPSLRENGEVPPALYERFEGFQLLGRGGMGAVYRAEDVRLRRSVAVKLLFEGDPGSRGGFLQEARSQARILHPNVCEVFEAGVADHVPFIVMRFVNGQPLHRMRTELSLEEKIRIVRQVSLAIHEAHRMGIIHRDVKPGNILVERLEDGSYRPFIADFGIARDVAEAPSGAARGVAGTPAYMAPEQASGKGLLDRRTDVYGLGATLYGILTGKAPFSAPRVRAVLEMVLERAPAPPRSIEPTIPLDLEAIVLKCLEKSPDARYESAKALAEDLQRFLDGDPVLARPRSLGVRLWKRARKHKVIVTVSAAAVVAVLTVAGLWLRSLRIAAQRETLARELGGAVGEMELFMRTAHLLPLHDLEHERGLMRGRLAEVEARTNAAGEVGVGPGHDALGRGFLALQDAAAALDHFREAEAAGYRAPGFDYSMGLALVEVYRQELEKASRIPKESDKAARIAEIQRVYRDPAIAHLRAALEEGVESPAYATGLIAYHEGRPEEALRHAQEAFVEAPWLYEAKKLEGDSYYAIGSRTRHDRVGFDYVRTMEQFGQAAEAYRTAAEVGRSDPSVHEAECELWIQIMNAAHKNHDAIRPPFERARAACERSIAASHRSPSGHVKLAFAYEIFSFWLLWRGGGGEPVDRALEEATDRVEAAARLSPDDAFASWLVGTAWRNRVYRLRAASKDSGAALDRSIAGYEAAIALDPTYLWAFNEVCEMLAMRGRREAWRGLDPWPSLERAHARCRRARELDPKLFGLSFNTLFVHVVDAERLVAAGRSPRATIDEALKLSETMEDEVAGEPWITAFRAALHLSDAEHALAAGEDATGALGRAEAQAARLPASFLAGDCAARVAAVAAEVHLARLLREPPPRARAVELEEALARASSGLRASLAARPDDMGYATWLAWLVRVEITRLRYRMALGQARWEDAEGVLAPLEQLQKRAPEEDPRLAEVAARARETRAELCEHLGRDPAPELDAGVRAAEQAIRLGPGVAAGYAALGRLRLRQARAAREPEQNRELSLRAARALEEAVKRNPLLARDHDSGPGAPE